MTNKSPPRDHIKFGGNPENCVYMLCCIHVGVSEKAWESLEGIPQATHRRINTGQKLHWHRELKHNLWQSTAWIISYSNPGVNPRKPRLKIKSQSPLAVCKNVWMPKVMPFQEQSEKEPPSYSSLAKWGRIKTCNSLKCESRLQATHTHTCSMVRGKYIIG